MDMIGTFPIHVLLDHRWASSSNEQCFIYLVAQHRGMLMNVISFKLIEKVGGNQTAFEV